VLSNVFNNYNLITNFIHYRTCNHGNCAIVQNPNIGEKRHETCHLWMYHSFNCYWWI